MTSFDEKDLGINPLLGSDFVILVRELTAKSSYKLTKEALLPIDFSLEKDNKVSIYTLSEYRKLVGSLSSYGQRLYLYVLYEAEYGRDYLTLNADRFIRENSMGSMYGYRKGLKELQRAAIICPSVVSGVFWINPRVFFAGNRVKKFPGSVVVKK